MISAQHFRDFPDPHRATYAAQKYLGWLGNCLEEALDDVADEISPDDFVEAAARLAQSRGAEWALLGRRAIGEEEGAYDDEGAARDFTKGVEAIEKACETDPQLARAFQQRRQEAGLEMSPSLSDTYTEAYEGVGARRTLPPRNKEQRERIDEFAERLSRAGEAVHDQIAEVVRNNESRAAKLAAQWHKSDCTPFDQRGFPVMVSEDFLDAQIKEFGRDWDTELKELPELSSFTPRKERSGPSLSL